ncbi:hypothetical protein VTK56DRAFT_6460 [Thermocarpiscus australiensis]
MESQQETMPPPPAGALLWPSLRIYQIYGANTGVGKTVFSTILSRASSREGVSTAYLKPVSTGPPDKADIRHVEKYAPGVFCRMLCSYDLEVSPHIAAVAPGRYPPSDEALLGQVRDFAVHCATSGSEWLFIETAGGVLSPGPSGSTQADLYMPLRLPVILIGDHKLGGISLTISAFESLRVRGYDVAMVLLFQEEIYQNYRYLTQYFQTRHGIPVRTMELPPPEGADSEEMEQYYEEASDIDESHDILGFLARLHDGRVGYLQSMAAVALERIWFPFTQHKPLLLEDVTVIDSAHGDHFQTVATQPASSDRPLLLPTFDGSASWWTQGLGHGNSKLSLAAAYAAGRYGHVTFAGAVHEPALALAETLLDGLQNPRLARVFFSDNGSTGMEVAVKMALRAAGDRYGWGISKDVEILGLKGSYHGDTIGVMDCSEPHTYNEKVEWYEPKGFWLQYPTVCCIDGQWVVEIPDAMGIPHVSKLIFPSLQDVFRLDKRDPEIRDLYKGYVLRSLREPGMKDRKFGALILEPIVLGAGGMVLVDPLFQRTLVDVVRDSETLFGESVRDSSTTHGDENAWKGLPVIFDEVFTGLYRLGRFSAASLLGVHPDISVHAKLLTGGLVPLAVTTASESIFRVFEGDDKSDALLHGHSYTAHPLGCQVALESVQDLQKMDSKGEWDWAKGANGWGGEVSGGNDKDAKDSAVWSVWSSSFVEWLSKQRTRPLRRVRGAWALGTILAIHLESETGMTGPAGYRSSAAAGIKAALFEPYSFPETLSSSASSWNVHSRALGDVFYLMASQKTTKEGIERLEGLLRGFFGGP